MVAQRLMPAQPQSGDGIHAAREQAQRQAIAIGGGVIRRAQIGRPLAARSAMEAADAFVATWRCGAIGASTLEEARRLVSIVVAVQLDVKAAVVDDDLIDDHGCFLGCGAIAPKASSRKGGGSQPSKLRHALLHWNNAIPALRQHRTPIDESQSPLFRTPTK